MRGTCTMLFCVEKCTRFWVLTVARDVGADVCASVDRVADGEDGDDDDDADADVGFGDSNGLLGGSVTDA